MLFEIFSEKFRLMSNIQIYIYIVISNGFVAKFGGLAGVSIGFHMLPCVFA